MKEVLGPNFKNFGIFQERLHFKTGLVDIQAVNAGMQ